MEARSDRFVQEMVDYFPNGVFVLFDDELRYRVVGPEVLPFSGREAADMEGKTIHELFPPTTVEQLEPPLQATIDGEPQSFDIEYDELTHHLESAPVSIDGDDFGVLITQDVTDARETAAELERQNERLEEFARIVSHDLRNPLTVAQGRLELVREDYESEDLEAIARAHERMAVLIEDLLTLARKGESVREVEPVTLDSLAVECWETIDRADARLEADSGLVVEADRSRLKQLIENLVRNAIEHGGDEVSISLGALDSGFYVEDDGPGIPNELRDDVLTPGFTTSQDGTGYGLSIVRDVAEAHDWTIKITSGGSGGARFEMTDVEIAM